MGQKRLVIFDFDGTLADSVEWFYRVLNEVARRYRFRETTPEEREELRRQTPLQILDSLGVPKWKVPIIAQHLRGLAAQNLNQIEIYGWVAQLLGELKDQGLYLAVVTSNTEENVRAILADSAALIDVYETGSSLFGKSAKFKRVLKQFKLSAAQAISVGDEVRDVDAARRVGIDSIAVGWGLSHPDALTAAKASALATTHHELSALLLARPDSLGMASAIR